jgi:hypothetical protein
MIMGFFDEISKIDPAGSGGNRLGVGHYGALKIASCAVANGFHGVRFVAEFEVLESTGPSATAAGETGSWTARIDGTWAKIGLGEVKAFVAAALGANPDDTAAVNALVTSELMSDVTERARLEGRVVGSDAYEKATKTGQKMVKHTWQPAAAGASAPPPPVPAVVAPDLAFPPAGWTAHPSAPGYYYRGTEVLTEAALRARA